MKAHTQYISDNQGNPVSVVVPFEEWQAFNERYKRLSNKLKVLSGIKSGILEVKNAKKTGEPLQSLNDFLDEMGY